MITAQTQPGNAGKLFFTLFDAGAQDDNGKKEYESKGFSVAAIPVNWSRKLEAKATKDLLTTIGEGLYRGLVVADSWQSDSGNISDLNEVHASELVDVFKVDSVIWKPTEKNDTSSYDDDHAMDKIIPYKDPKEFATIDTLAT